MEIKLDQVSMQEYLTNFSYTFQGGQITTIMYENDLTKQTLISLLIGNTYPLIGYITIDSNYLTHQNRPTYRKQISYTTPNPSEKFFCRTVHNELNQYKRLTKEEQIGILNQVGLTKDFLNRHPLSLSLSEQIKLNFAISLISPSKLFILDEPTKYLDYSSQITITNLIKTLKQQGKTIIIFSNSLSLLHSITNHIIIINQGKLIIATTPKELPSHLHHLEKHSNIPLPPILNFINLANQTKDVKLKLTYEIKELMKDIYRHVS